MRRCAWRLGYEVRRRVDFVDFVKSRNIDLVLDVGANTGQFAQELRKRGYQESIISFEPVSTTYQQLQRAACADPNWQVRHAALGREQSEATINIAENSVYSSLRSQTEVAQRFDRRSATVGTEQVPVTTVDAVLEGQPQRRVFLKIDTQGFEREILAGTSMSLAFILGILLEVPIVHFYEGTWTLEEVLTKLRSMGFVLAQITPTGYLKQLDPVSVTEVDCLFRRVDERLDGISVGERATEQAASLHACDLSSPVGH